MDEWSLLIIVLALGAGALCKGVMGMGLPMIAMPILASFLGVPHAVTVLSIPIVVTNAWQVWHYRSEASSLPFMRAMLITGTLGVGLGTAFLTVAPERGLSLVLGLLLIAYLALRFTKPTLTLPDSTMRRLAPVTGLVAGVLQGSTALSGPVLVTYFHSLRLGREAYIYAISVIFTLLSVLHLPALAVAGLLTGPRLLESMFALIPVALVMPVGAWIGARINHALFDKLVLVFITVMAARFIWGALAG